MSRLWKIAGIAALVVILGTAILGAIAFAQDPEVGQNWPFDFREKMHEAIAEILGVEVDEYDAAIEQAHEQVLGEAVTEGWLTEDQAEQMRERHAEGIGPRGMDKSFFGSRMGFMGRGGNSFLAVAADELGMTASELMEELGNGKSIAEIAQEKGVDTQAIVDAHQAKLAETLAGAVEDGRITQKQADWMLEQSQERITEQLESTWEDCGPHRGPGRMWDGGRPGRPGGFPGKIEGTTS